jgi:hypothetical protein
MANLDRPRGFAPKGKVKQAIKAQAGSAVYPGDCVSLASDGQWDATAAGAVIGGVALQYAGTAGDYFMVSIDPDQLYVAQGDDNELDAQTDIGNCCDILATAGDTTYKASRHEVDSSTIGASAAQLLIMDINPRTNNAGGANCEVVVKINEHQLKDAYAGI